MCHNKILDFVSGRLQGDWHYADSIMCHIIVGHPEENDWWQETFSYKAEWTLATVCRSFVRASSENRDREGNEKKRKKKGGGIIFTGVKGGLKRGGKKTEVGGIIWSFSKNVEKKENAGVTTSGRLGREIDFFSPIFSFSLLFSPLVFQEKWGKRCSHPVELIVGDLTPSPLLAGLSMNVRYSANIPDQPTPYKWPDDYWK